MPSGKKRMSKIQVNKKIKEVDVIQIIRTDSAEKAPNKDLANTPINFPTLAIFTTKIFFLLNIK
jgi:hypothetical protein